MSLVLILSPAFPSNCRCQGVQVSGSSRSSASTCLRSLSRVFHFGSPSQKSACHFQKTCVLVLYFCMCKARKGHRTHCQFSCVLSSGKAVRSLPSRRISVMLFSCTIEGIVLQFYNRIKTSSIAASKK